MKIEIDERGESPLYFQGNFIGELALINDYFEVSTLVSEQVFTTAAD